MSGADVAALLLTAAVAAGDRLMMTGDALVYVCVFSARRSYNAAVVMAVPSVCLSVRLVIGGTVE